MISRHEPDHPAIVVADNLMAFFLLQPTWVKDIRPFRSGITNLHLPQSQSDVDRFIPRSAMNLPWVKRARERYSMNIVEALRGAMRDLGLAKGKVGFEYAGLADLLGFSGLREVDGHGPVVFARQVRTRIREPFSAGWHQNVVLSAWLLLRFPYIRCKGRPY